MTGFAGLQDAFQRAILEGDDAVLSRLTEGARESRETLLAVYRNAYVLRLAEVMRNENPLLHAYLGDEHFDAMARAYVAARPSRHPNARWFCQGLPDFLAGTPPYDAFPAVAELSALETALSNAFDAPDDAVLGLPDFGQVPPDAFTALVFRPHASACRLDVATNVFAIWSALRDEETPPEAESGAAPDRLLVWRQDETAMVRSLEPEEAMLWDEAGAGLPFGVLCEMAATYDDPDGAAARVAGYLQGWVAAGLLAGLTIGAIGG